MAAGEDLFAYAEAHGYQLMIRFVADESQHVAYGLEPGGRNPKSLLFDLPMSGDPEDGTTIYAVEVAVDGRRVEARVSVRWIMPSIAWVGFTVLEELPDLSR